MELLLQSTKRLIPIKGGESGLDSEQVKVGVRLLLNACPEAPKLGDGLLVAREDVVIVEPAINDVLEVLSIAEHALASLQTPATFITPTKLAQGV